jgi:hypothetical protein
MGQEGISQGLKPPCLPALNAWAEAQAYLNSKSDGKGQSRSLRDDNKKGNDKSKGKSKGNSKGNKGNDNRRSFDSATRKVRELLRSG